MFSFMFVIVHYQTSKGDNLKYRPFVYVGILIYLTFLIYFFYLHFTMPV